MVNGALRSAGQVCWILLLLVLGVGCDQPQPQPAPSEEPETSVTYSDPVPTGTLRGRVTWRGELPVVPPLEVRSNPLAPGTYWRRHRAANPNAPTIDPVTKGVANALLFLRRQAPVSPRPWDHPPVVVEIRNNQFVIHQGERQGCVGLVRCGDTVEFVSRDNRYHSVRGRGANFFAYALPDPGRPRHAKLDQGGIVELTSGAGHYWMRAYLFVADSPLCTLTDRQGNFVLHDVPAGSYQLCCWLPNWQIARQERDPESGAVSRLAFQPPHTRVQAVTVHEDTAAEANFVLSLSPDDVEPR